MEFRISKPKPDGSVNTPGIQFVKTPIWWHSIPNDPDRVQIGNIIVLQVPGGSGWYRRGESKYYGTEFYVVRAISDWEEDFIKVIEIVSFPVRKKK